MSKYRVKVGDRLLDVEIRDVTSHPVVAIVDDQEFEVWIQEEEGPCVNEIQPASAAPITPRPNTSDGGLVVESIPDPRKVAAQPGKRGNGCSVVRAPMPGQIIQINVSKGDLVERGQILCVLEAMKMNNQIRAPHHGTIGEIHVAQGVQVNYGDPLVGFE